MNRIEEILRQSMGLEASSIGASTVEQVVRARMAQVGAATPDEYLVRLRELPGELAELIEAVVVPESWFFRDGAPFAALTKWTVEQWQPAHPGATLRVLTIPCSTGEEPYSVAMALLGGGMPPERFTVDAVDISHRALARAKRAVYGQNSFRGEALEFRARHFTQTPEGYALAEEVKRQVRFENGNVLAPDFRPGGGRFDVIFCRNLLIYFDRPRQTRALKKLSAMLAPDGLLFVGHAETSIPATAGLATANYPRSFAFRKAAAVAAAPIRKAKPAPVPIVPRPAQVEKPPQPVAAPAGLDAARAFADRGALVDAARLCEEHLRQRGASADAWYLLGTIRDAAGDRVRAAECFAKTLYLEPGHEDALLQRALLAEQSGDLAGAAQFRRRIARVKQRSVAA